MSWATTLGLFAILGIVWATAEICAIRSRNKKIKHVENEIKAAETKLQNALLEEPNNLQLHCNLRARLLRLQRERESIY